MCYTAITLDTEIQSLYFVISKSLYTRPHFDYHKLPYGIITPLKIAAKYGHVSENDVKGNTVMEENMGRKVLYRLESVD